MKREEFASLRSGDMVRLAPGWVGEWGTGIVVRIARASGAKRGYLVFPRRDTPKPVRHAVKLNTPGAWVLVQRLTTKNRSRSYG